MYVLCVSMQKSVHVCVLCCNLWLPFCVQYVLCMHVFCVVLAGCAFICAFFAAYSCVSALSVGICAQGNRVMCSRVTCRTKIDRLSKLTKSIEYIIGIWTYNSDWQVFEAPLENLLRMFFYISIHIIFPASKQKHSNCQCTFSLYLYLLNLWTPSCQHLCSKLNPWYNTKRVIHELYSKLHMIVV